MTFFDQDILWMLGRLSNVKSATCISGYNHGDFIFVMSQKKYFKIIFMLKLINFTQGKDVKEKLYDQVIALLPPP